jgi:sec-independent protein translocase protein TatA
MNLGAPELLIVLVVILVLFGGAKLPKLARSIGQAQKEFKQGLDDPSKPEPVAAPAPAPLPAAESITMTKADLEALIADREAKARRDASTSD